MDKSQAIHNFWSRFGIPAYDEFSVPDKAQLPYITYGVSTGSMDDSLNLSASVWYRGSSWAEISMKVDEIETYIGYSGLISPIDGGYIYITKGSPFAQRMDGGDKVKRVYLNIQAEFLTK